MNSHLLGAARHNARWKPYQSTHTYVYSRRVQLTYIHRERLFLIPSVAVAAWWWCNNYYYWTGRAPSSVHNALIPMTWPHIDILLRGRFQFTVSLENLFFNQHRARTLGRWTHVCKKSRGCYSDWARTRSKKSAHAIQYQRMRCIINQPQSPASEAPEECFAINEGGHYTLLYSSQLKCVKNICWGAC